VKLRQKLRIIIIKAKGRLFDVSEHE